MLAALTRNGNPAYAPTMGEVQLSAEQIATLARWSTSGSGMAPVDLIDEAPRYVDAWQPGDVVAVQGDAHVQLSCSGRIKEAVPPVDLD